MEEKRLSSMAQKIRDAVIRGEPEETRILVKKAIDDGIDPLEIMNNGLTSGIRELGKRFEEGTAFLPDLIMGGNAVKAGYDVISTHLPMTKQEKVGKFLIGTVEGDIHDIGKNIVKTMLEASGFEVRDLGVDVPTTRFIEEVKNWKPNILGMSALLTMTRVNQKEVIEALKREGLRDKVKVMVGGAPISEEWAYEIGADGYAEDAMKAVQKALELLKM
jgi:5-methyltetrahydrofolate--homocysteine methyltransferase